MPEHHNRCTTCLNLAAMEATGEAMLSMTSTMERMARKIEEFAEKLHLLEKQGLVQEDKAQLGRTIAEIIREAARAGYDVGFR